VYLDQPDGWQVSKACLDRSYTDLPTQPLDEWLGSAPGLLDAIQAGALVEHLVRRPGSVPPTTVRAAFRNYQHLPRGPRRGLSASRAVRSTMRSLPTVSKTPEDDAHSRRPNSRCPLQKHIPTEVPSLSAEQPAPPSRRPATRSTSELERDHRQLFRSGQPRSADHRSGS
jgi:hypothetical protein